MHAVQQLIPPYPSLTDTMRYLSYEGQARDGGVPTKPAVSFIAVRCCRFSPLMSDGIRALVPVGIKTPNVSLVDKFL